MAPARPGRETARLAGAVQSATRRINAGRSRRRSAAARSDIWSGFNANGQTTSGTFTFSVRGTTEDGERINFHVTERFNERPDGTVNKFFRCHD